MSSEKWDKNNTSPLIRKRSRSSKTRVKSISSDWKNIVEETQEALKRKLKNAYSLLGAPTSKRFTFCTGTTYDGKWNTLGMTKHGKFFFPDGCEYEGGFDDGMFHGRGCLTYPMGQKLEGVWDKGRLISYKFSNADGLDYDINWNYCIMPDRRFNVSIREGLQPAGREFMTNQQPERPIEEDCYDTVDGFYHPIKRCVILARDPEDYAHLEERDEPEEVEKNDNDWISSVVMVTKERHDWIVKHCRKSWDEPAGYRPEFYEHWITGRQSELEELEKKYEQQRVSISSTFDDIESNDTTQS